MQYEACQKRADEIAEIIRSYIPIPKPRGEKKDITVTSNVTEAEFTDMVCKGKRTHCKRRYFSNCTVTAF